MQPDVASDEQNVFETNLPHRSSDISLDKRPNEFLQMINNKKKATVHPNEEESKFKITRQSEPSYNPGMQRMSLKPEEWVILPKR